MIGAKVTFLAGRSLDTDWISNGWDELETFFLVLFGEGWGGGRKKTIKQTERKTLV